MGCLRLHKTVTSKSMNSQSSAVWKLSEKCFVITHGPKVYKVPRVRTHYDYFNQSTDNKFQKINMLSCPRIKALYNLFDIFIFKN